MQEAALVQQVLYPYLCALTYLHSRGIIHRDIKPENTVFTRECVLKITGKEQRCVGACTPPALPPAEPARSPSGHRLWAGHQHEGGEVRHSPRHAGLHGSRGVWGDVWACSWPPSECVFFFCS